MNTFLRRISLTIALILWGCSSVGMADTPERETGTLKLLTLGDSRVEGAPPEFESYRYALWKQALKSDMSLDFIGPLRDTYDYAPVEGQIFDPDHAGVGGFTTQDVLDNLEDILSATFTPDIVLLGIGGNDLIGTNRTPEAVADNVERIIQRLRVENPNVTVFVEQIAPGKPDAMSDKLTGLFASYNQEITQSAAAQTSTASAVIVVDMTEGWTSEFLADDVHYNRAGAQHVAQKYFDALVERGGE